MLLSQNKIVYTVVNKIYKKVKTLSRGSCFCFTELNSLELRL